MANPYSANPSLHLAPFPAGCSGWRLWRMLNQQCGASKADYMSAFQRDNLIKIGNWNLPAARRAAVSWVQLVPAGATVVVLGEAVRACLNWALAERYLTHSDVAVRCEPIRKILVDSQELDGLNFCHIPHPSGKNLFYNSPANRVRIAKMLAELYRQETETHA